MKEFNEKSYWCNRYENDRHMFLGDGSGAGSQGEEAVSKAICINHWIKEYGMRTITEFGCGTGENLKLYDIPISYNGYDFSEKAIEICKEKFKNHRNSLKYYFGSTIDALDLDADLMLSLDVHYHMPNDDVYQEYCDVLFNQFRGKYIIIYSTDTDSQFTEDGHPLAKHVRFRPVLDKVKEYPQWEVLFWSSGIRLSDDKYYKFPSLKRFFLLKRK